MARTLKRIIVLAVAVSLFSCFSITVNVYFPAKDVKSAFKSLEKDLMKGGGPEGGTEGGEKPAAPDEKAPDDKKPRTEGGLLFEFGVSEAYAQGPGEFAGALESKLRGDPSVVNAYAGMGSRLGFINKLRDQGVVGEGGDGLLKPRGELGKKESAALAEENADRQAIIKAMAKALVELNNQPVNDGTVGQVLDKAAAQFASVRAESARPGWWVQKPDGSWAKK